MSAAHSKTNQTCYASAIFGKAFVGLGNEIDYLAVCALQSCMVYECHAAITATVLTTSQWLLLCLQLMNNTLVQVLYIHNLGKVRPPQHLIPVNRTQPAL